MFSEYRVQTITINAIAPGLTVTSVYYPVWRGFLLAAMDMVLGWGAANLKRTSLER